MQNIDVKIEDSWKENLKDEFQKEYFLKIREKYHQAIKVATILPPPKFIFYAFSLVKFDDVKVVILGQDPYHNIENNIPQAHGLSFSVPYGVNPPPSLKNIFKELNRDLGVKIPKCGNLSNWSKEGVLLLNSILSVEYKKPLSHSHFGWEIFTDKIIETLSQKKENLIFMLWGNYARSKKNLIDTSKHHILEAPHPSPLARGFIGCSHFSKCNEILKQNGIKEIDWNLS
ncbi:uracil-DNA glycosylase [Helicobacter sp. MIT 99-5507]|uniref:uracil-DNA glycosylase n=1 Tax=Helicobacter sp. MIT 99-5507 TaxID=152489 RepID=UPI000E1E7401|nr:uracil-DNA glycosylase [Helicobacter sp. MIT 99-5507]RDU57566.1 uracil-DNA glycosylase [Helicobacter sp. MIT 99-5507]